MFNLRNCIRSTTKFAQLTRIGVERNERQIARWVSPTLKELKRRKDKLGPVKKSPRSSYLEWNYEAEIYAFGQRLGEPFNRELLKRALIHKCYANMKKDENESIEILHNSDLIQEGDSIINDYLKEKFSKLYVEDIADSFVKYLTTEEMLAHVAKHLGLTDLIFTSEDPVEQSTLANTFKAVIAALKQSVDLERAEKFLKDFLLVQLNGKLVSDIWEPQDPITYLNNILKERGIENYEARLCNESASNTILASYQVGLYSNKELLGIGWGENIEVAKNTAALDAIQRIYQF